MSWEIKCIGTLDKVTSYVKSARAYGNGEDSQCQIDPVKEFLLQELERFNDGNQDIIVQVNSQGHRREGSRKLSIFIERVNVL